MEPSGLEPLTPCMPCSVLQGLDSLRSNGPVVILNFDLRQIMRQAAKSSRAWGLGLVKPPNLLPAGRVLALLVENEGPVGPRPLGCPPPGG
jgi:hypothetical protein